MNSPVFPCPNEPRLLCIADPNSLRWKAFEKAVGAFAKRTGRDIHLDLIGWHDLIAADGDLLQVPKFDSACYSKRPALLRIESPARDFEVVRALLAAGARETEVPEDMRWSRVESKIGKLVEPRLVFAGLKRVLSGLHRSVPSIHGIQSLASPVDILTMFDKNQTSRLLLAADISTPQIDENVPWKLAASQDYNDDELVDAALDFIRDLKEQKRDSVYVKLESGSSASGIVHLQLQNESEFNAVSTMILIDGLFFNTRLLQTLDASQLGRQLHYLFRQGATVQQGIKKAQIGGENFDVRAVVVDGKVEFTVFRISQHPFTNLHLGGYRGDWDRCRRTIPDRIWLDAMDACVEAAGLFQTHVVGIDLTFDRHCLNHYIIELNPFGDFFPGWKNPDGESIYEVELKTLFQPPPSPA